MGGVPTTDLEKEYARAKKACEDFDAKHERKKAAYIALGKMLEHGGWGAIELVRETRPVSAGQLIPGDFEPIHPADLAGDVVVILGVRRSLQQAYRDALSKLPAASRKKLGPQPGRRTK
jgi:hypothetical protein